MPPPLPSSARSKVIMEPEYHGYPTSQDHLEASILEKTGFTAREFQLQAALAILHGHDVVVHAGTGSGKTLIFAAPHFVLENKVSIIISPLILLQQDQQERMRKMGLSAIAINQEVHLEAKVWDDLADAKYQIVLLSPEMALHSEQAHKVFASSVFRRALIAINVDEAHTVSLWGGDFRKAYKGLGRVRARLSKGVPVAIVSATLRPNVKQDAMSTLGFSKTPSDYVDINVGNERVNVFVGARIMKFPVSTFRDLSMLIDPNETDPKNIPKSIVYIDDVNDVTLAVIALNSWLHTSLRGCGLIMPVHAWMTPSYRSNAMAKFTSGEVRILVCTEAAGMGCDIPDIKRVVQYRLCRSIDAFMQRIGRCWRGPNGTGEGWLIAETWVHDGKGGSTGARARKSCDPLLRKFIIACDCRRRYLNLVYANPPSENQPVGRECCDLCDPESSTRFTYRTFPNERGAPRATAASGKSNPEMLACLIAWRKAVFPTVFGQFSMFGASALISDHDLERISRCAPVPSVEQLRRYLIKWSRVESHLDSMWAALKEGGFTEIQPPTEGNTPATAIQPASASQTARKPWKSSASQRGDEQPASQGKPSNAFGSTSHPTGASPAVHRGWFSRTWMPERNYEVRQDVTMEDFRHMFAEKKGKVKAESSESTYPQPALPESTPKCRPLQSASTESTSTSLLDVRVPTLRTGMAVMGPPSLPAKLRARPRTSSMSCDTPSSSTPSAMFRQLTAPSSPAPKRRRLDANEPSPSTTFQMPARSVGRLVVPSQRPFASSSTFASHPYHPALASKTKALNMHPRAYHPPAELKHPTPIRTSKFTLLGSTMARAPSALTPISRRPQAPRPSSRCIATTSSRDLRILMTREGAYAARFTPGASS